MNNMRTIVMNKQQKKIYDLVDKSRLDEKQLAILERFAPFNDIADHEQLSDPENIDAIAEIYAVCDRYGASVVRSIALCWRAEDDARSTPRDPKVATLEAIEAREKALREIA